MGLAVAIDEDLVKGKAVREYFESQRRREGAIFRIEHNGLQRIGHGGRIEGSGERRFTIVSEHALCNVKYIVHCPISPQTKLWLTLAFPHSPASLMCTRWEGRRSSGAFVYL